MKKIIVLVLCVLLLMSASVIGTLAWLTSKATVTNTFTTGNIEIKLDEAAVNGIGQPTGGARTTTGNTDVKIVPGRTITKDPTVWVKQGSESAYIRMKVTVTHYSELRAIFGEDFKIQDYVEGYNNEVWTYKGMTVDAANDTATFEFRYNGVYTVSGADDFVALPALFQSFKLPGEKVNSTQLATMEGLKISVIAEAIQSVSFANADAAWAAFEAQNP